jgi:hypothetical protein
MAGWGTISAVAGGLARYGDAHGLSEENAATAWGRATAGLDLVPHLDPYIGRMDGIGVALFYIHAHALRCRYARARCAVAHVLTSLGFDVGRGETTSVLVTATYAARAIGARLIELDQLLWYAEELH